jgi:predicted transcriptional regulator
VPGIERTNEQRAADLKEMARLRLFGNSQTAIAEKLGISQATVSRDLAEIVKGWKAEAVADMDEIKAKELAKLDALEVEAYEAWQGSKKESQKTVVEERPGRNTSDEKPGKGANAGKFIKVEKQTSDGDPRFLQALLAIQDRRAKIQGFDVPVKFDGTVTNKATINASALSDSALAEIMAARDALAAAQAAQDATPATPDDSDSTEN